MTATAWARGIAAPKEPMSWSTGPGPISLSSPPRLDRCRSQRWCVRDRPSGGSWRSGDHGRRRCGGGRGGPGGRAPYRERGIAVPCDRSGGLVSTVAAHRVAILLRFQPELADSRIREHDGGRRLLIGAPPTRVQSHREAPSPPRPVPAGTGGRPQRVLGYHGLVAWRTASVSALVRSCVTCWYSGSATIRLNASREG